MSDTRSSLPDRPSLLSRSTLALLLWLYRRMGWTIEGNVPKDRRFVIIGAPHTSNWDFVFFLGVTHELGIRPNFMGKDSLFRWPLRRFMLEMGGVPVVRSSSRNYVEQMVAEFEQRREMMLVVAPEGTRGGAVKWKTGFYHIALAAKVPIVLAWLNYETKRGGMGPAIMPSGDFAADMARIAEFYAHHGQGKHPEKTRTDFAAMIAGEG